MRVSARSKGSACKRARTASATRAAASASATVEIDFATGANSPSTATIPTAKIATAATTSSNENPRTQELPRWSGLTSSRFVNAGSRLARDSDKGHDQRWAVHGGKRLGVKPRHLGAEGFI